MLPQKVLHLHIEEKKKKPNIQHDYLISEKLDGWYTYIDYIVGLGWGYVHSRQGRIIPSMEWAKSEFEKLPKPSFNCRLIMEAIIPGLDFHTMNGIFNRSIGDCQAKEAIFLVHDIINKDIYWQNIPENKAIERYNRLITSNIGKNSKHIFTHNILGIASEKHIWAKYFLDIMEKSGEGIILKQCDALYQPDKRNSSLMKMKLEETFDLLCIDLVDTIGEKGNPNTNMILERKDGTKVTIRIGKHEDIKEFKSIDGSPLRKVVEIKAMCELPDGSFREPRFLKIRDDKTYGDID
jgi:ATP-dependent DNA ligase